MKKLLSLSLVLSLMLCFTACGEEESKSSSTTETAETVTEQIAEETTEEIADDFADEEYVEPTFPLPDGVSFGQYILEDFKSLISENPDMTAEELAAKLSSENEAILFSSVTSPVVEGPLQGFNTDITGFKSGAMFGPAMSSIAFVGYVFELNDESEADAFVENLKSNANPAWQVCVEAEETICEAVGNKVFFVMAPLSNQ